MLGIFAIVTIVICGQSFAANADPTEIKLNAASRVNMVEIIARDGYYSENHDVITDDGYILEVNRIPNGRFESGPIEPGSKPVVFLMHGLQSSATSFILLGPEFSFAYILADAGYDVWMGNARGILNSRRHVTLNPDHHRDKFKFFDYTYEDVGVKDLPAMIDYVLGVTNQEQLSYVGHSQGGTAFFVLNSLLPEYNKKFSSAHLMGGVGFQNYFPTTILRLLAKKTDVIFAAAKAIGVVELPGFDFNNKILGCSDEYKDSPECLVESALDVLSELHVAEISAGASVKQYALFGQNIRDRSFRQWNYGPLKNLLIYGRLFPPEYDLSLVSVDITMHYTNNDIFLYERDVLNMAKVLPNAKVRKVADDSFSHFDFVISPNSRELVVDYIVERINAKNK